MELDSVANDNEYSKANNDINAAQFNVQDVSINLDSNENGKGSAVMIKNEKQEPPNITFKDGYQDVEDKQCLPDDLE